MPIAVDIEARTIQGVAVMSPGVTVDGRYTVDQTTIEQVYNLMAARADGTPVLGRHFAEADELVGRVVSPRIDEDGVLRGDVEIFRAAEAGDLLLEAAAKMPTGFGMSINAPEASAEGDQQLLRVQSLASVDFAQLPAANRNGLLSAAAVVDSAPNSSTDNATAPDMTPEEVQTLLSAAVEPLAAEIASLKAKLAEYGDKPDEDKLAVAAAAKADEAVKLAVASAKAEAVKEATETVFAALNASLGARLATTFRAAAPTDANAGDPSAPQSILKAAFAKLAAEGVTGSDVYRLAAQRHPSEYRAALAAGTLPKA